MCISLGAFYFVQAEWELGKGWKRIFLWAGVH